ncbi:MAG: ABC transporter permease [Verrucomicrobia bacterium]|nr:ABC transporter permease [Verrucomicrobiota bacterium]
MNANTRLRLWKEARALLPFWAAMVGLTGLPALLGLREGVAISIAAYVFGCALLGSVIIGQEFQHRTMGLLLSQPVSRRRLWWERMFVLGAALLSLVLWLILLGALKWHLSPFRFRSDDDQFAAIVCLLLPLFLGFCTAPMLTLLARGTIGGIALTFLCPWVVFLFCLWLLPDEFALARHWIANTMVFLTTYGIYAGALLLLGCRRFQRLEDIHGHGQELSLPAALMRPFAGFTERLTLNHGGALGQLVRKELRLHLPAFVVAGILVGVWLLLLAVVLACPSVSKDFLLLPAVLLGLSIPVIAGIVSTAEERSLGVHEWHLTLPVSARRQWFIKVLVALAVNVALGLLLPGLLGQISSVLLEGKSMELGLLNGEQHFLIANAVIFCAALYASTAAANSTRALVGTIVLFVAVPLLLFPLINYLGVNQPEFSPLMLLLSQVLIMFVPTTFLPELLAAALFGAIVLSVIWLCALGLANFRRSLDSYWRPVRQMAGFFVSVGLLLFALAILGRSLDFLRSRGWTF